jgi:hypothetical protein
VPLGHIVGALTGGIKINLEISTDRYLDRLTGEGCEQGVPERTLYSCSRIIYLSFGDSGIGVAYDLETDFASRIPTFLLGWRLVYGEECQSWSKGFAQEDAPVACDFAPSCLQ